MRVELKFSTTWTEYEAEKGIQITDVLHKGLDPADNEARVTFVQNITLYNLFRGMTPGQKVPARIYDDADALVFFGYIARSFSVTKKQRLQPIKVQLVSPTNYLKSKIPETLAYTTIRVSAASAATPSLVRHVLKAAGYADADIVIPNVTATIPAVVIEENTQTYFDVVKNALKEFGYILDFDETGKTKYYELFPASVASTHTFDGSNIRGSVVQSIRPEEYDAVHVQYPEVETVTSALLFKDTTDPAGLNDCTVNIDPSSYLNGEEFWYAEYSSDRGEILAASGAALDIIKDSEISVLSFSGLAKRAKLSIRNTSATLVRTIRRLRITGSAVVQTGVSVVKRAKTTETEKVYEFDTQYIFAKVDAENLANKLASYFDTSDFTYLLGSEDRVAIGAIVTVTETGIGSNLCRVTERKYDGKIGLYTYKLEAIANYVAPPVSSSDRYVFNSPESAGTIDALAGEIAARPTSSTLSTAPATPASLTARAVQDGIILLAAPGGAPGLDNSAAYYRYQVSRDGGLTWPGDWTAAAQAEFRFDRDVDGYPDSVSLYRARVKAVSAAGVESVSWLTVTVDGTGYLGWTPGTPGLSGAADNRTAELRLVVGGSYYGHSRFEVQIQRDGDGANWYAPGDSGAARDSETAYRGALNGYATAYADTFAQTLPLTNQGAGLPENTSYLYRIRAVVAKPTTAAPDAVARSAWTAAITVVAKPTGTVDIVEKAIKTAQLDKSAVTIEKLNVLAKNLVNDLTDDTDGTTGWNLIGGSTVEVDSAIGRRALNMPAVTHASYCDPFAVGPNDIIEVDASFRAITASTGARLRLGVDGGAQLQYSTWDATAKAWGVFGGSVTFRDCGITATTGSYTAVKSYIVGQNVKPGDIPAPVNAAECVRVVSSPTVGIGLVVIGTTSRVYAFAPSARKVGSGKITAPQIVTKNLAAISAKLGEIEGDTADYKLVMGSGGSAEEGTLLLGATTDASYFRRWKEGGVWKMAIKLATLFVDAVSSKILGLFQVRNSYDTSTVFEVDPVTGKMDHDGLRRYGFPVHNITATAYTWIRVCKIGFAGPSGTGQRFEIRIVGKQGWNGRNSGGEILITGSFNYLGSDTGTDDGVGAVAHIFQANSNTGAGDSPQNQVSGVYLVRQSGYHAQERDVYLQIPSAAYTRYYCEVTTETAGATVTKYGTFTNTSPLSAPYYTVPMRRVIEESPTGLTTLADVTASSLGVSGNAQVGSLNGATPGGGGLELLGLASASVAYDNVTFSQIGSSVSVASGLEVVESIDASTLAVGGGSYGLRTYKRAGTTWTLEGSVSSIYVKAMAALNTSDVAVIGIDRRLRTCRWNGTSWETIGSTLLISGIDVHDVALTSLSSTDIAMVDSTSKVLQSYRWNGSSWSALGTGLTISGISYISITALNSKDIALVDGVLDVLQTYTFNGSSWSALGTGLTISGSGRTAVTAINSTDVAFIDNNNDSMRSYRWTGSSWEMISPGMPISGISGFVSLTSINSSEIVLLDTGTYTLRTYRINPQGTPTIPTVTEESTYTIERTRLSVTIAFEAGCTQGTVYSVITDLLGTSGDIGCPGRYGTKDIGYLLITSTSVKIKNVNNDILRIECTKGSSTAIPVRIAIMFPV